MQTPVPAPVVPTEAIQRLTSALEPLATEMKVIPRKKISWDHQGKPQLYLFRQGELSILRATDGLLIVTVYEPHLIGIAEMMQPLRCHQLRAETQSTIFRVDAHQAMTLFQQQGLWQDVASVLAYHTAYLFYRDALVMQQRTWSVIRSYLLEMIQLPEETRMRVSILDYIQTRTHLSRSSVLNVLSALKKENLIQFNRGGYLVSITQLPEKI